MAVLALLWRPYFPASAVLLAALGLAALAVWAAARSYGQGRAATILTLPMRIALIVGIALLLLGPSRLPESTTAPTRPVVTFLVDTSASMQTPDVEGKPRFAFIAERWLGAERLAELRRDYDVRVLGFDQSARPIQESLLRQPAEVSATGSITNVLGSVGAAVADASINGTTADAGPATFVVLSDGRDTADAAAAALGSLGGGNRAAVHTVTLGGPNLRRDVAVVAVPLQEYLLVDEEGQIAVRVVHSGAAGETATLRLRGPDGEETRPIAFSEEEHAVRLTFPVKQAAPGAYEYELSVDALPNEVEARNNSQPVFIEVTKKRLAVLLLEGEPYWDTKFLAQSLRKDDRIELTQIVQVSEEKQEKLVSRLDSSSEASASERKTRVLPKTVEQFRRYDVVILGRGLENLLAPDAARALAMYVNEFGGRVVFARGRPYDASDSRGRLVGEALASIEPVVFGNDVLQGVKLSAERSGQSHPLLALTDRPEDRTAVLGELPGFLTAHEVKREKAATQVLARTGAGGGGGGGRGQPALVTMPAGRGVVLAVLGEGLWKWSLVGRENRRLAEVFDRFWSNGVRWLAMGGDFQPGKEVSVRLSRRSVQIGEPVLIDVSTRVSGDEVTLAVHGPGESRAQPALGEAGASGRRRATFEPTEPGVYRVVADAPGLEAPVEASFNVYELDLERLECAADPYRMRMIAEESGGQVLDPYDPDALDELLERQRQASIVPPRPEYVWNRTWVMVLLLGWAGGEWLIRKKGGLL